MIAVDQALSIPYVMIRIYQIVHEQVSFEDFFISDEQGLSERIPLFVQCEYELYQIELRSSGYEVKKLRNIKIFADKKVFLEETLACDTSVCKDIEAIPTFSGTCLQLYDEGEAVRLLQCALHTLASQYSQLSIQERDGVFGQATKAAIITFQQLFSLPVEGIVDEDTWTLLFSLAYDMVKKKQPYVGLPAFQGVPLRIGMHGKDVLAVQHCLTCIAQHYANIPKLHDCFMFDADTQASLLAFQHMLGIAESGVVDKRTWCLLQAMYQELQD